MVLARVIRQFPHLIQDRLRPRGDFLAGEGQRNEVSPALDELHAEFPLQFLDLHGKGRLRDGALIGRQAEMLHARQRLEISELSERDHRAIRITDRSL